MEPFADPYDSNPMNHPPEQPTGVEGDFQLGKLMVVLGSAVGFIGALAISMGGAYT